MWVLDAIADFFDRTGLMLAQDDFGEDVIFGEKEDVIFEDIEKAIAVKKVLNFVFVVDWFWLLIFPVKDIFAIGCPSESVVKIKELSDFKDLGSSKYFGRFSMVAA